MFHLSILLGRGHHQPDAVAAAVVVEKEDTKVESERDHAAERDQEDSEKRSYYLSHQFIHSINIVKDMIIDITMVTMAMGSHKGQPGHLGVNISYIH